MSIYLDENGGWEEGIICTHTGQQSIANGQNASASSNMRNSTQERNILGARDAAIAAGVAGTAGVVAPVAGTAILTGVGFTSASVAGGSMAAAIQAGIGNVAAGSLFATFQSVGATGGFALLGPVGLGAAAVGGLGYLEVRAIQNWRSDKNQNESRESPIEKTGNNKGVANVRPMCLECRRELLLRITRNFFRNRHSFTNL